MPPTQAFIRDPELPFDLRDRGSQGCAIEFRSFRKKRPGITATPLRGSRWLPRGLMGGGPPMGMEGGAVGASGTGAGSTKFNWGEATSLQRGAEAVYSF